MKRTNLVASVLLLLAAGLFVGCDRVWDTTEESGNVGISWYLVVDTTETMLVAGRTINAGTVKVWNDEQNLYVRYSTAGDWRLDETHVAVAASLAGIPQTRTGNPIPGRFPYGTIHQPRVTEFTYTIPLNWPAGTELYVATHASLVVVDSGGSVLRQETGWGNGPSFPGKNWAMYFRYTVQRVHKDVRLPREDIHIQMRGWHPNGTYSYWDIELAGVPAGYDVWNGHWNGWCAERTVYMTPGVWYDVSLWSTCNPNLPLRVQNAGWDNVNYLLNHKHPNATLFDTEEAIWWLLGNGPYPTDPEAILMAEDAAANGNGWRPGTGDWIAVVTETADNVQLCFIEVDP